MIVNRPSLFVFAVRDVWLTSDVAVTVTFSTGFLSGPRTRPRMMSASPCACRRDGANAPRSRTRISDIDRRGDTGGLEGVRELNRHLLYAQMLLGVGTRVV